MNKLLISILLIFLVSPSMATHLMGGQITWKCLPSGEFVFYMEIYRNCQTPNGGPAASWIFQHETINISGVNLPRSANNSIISNILMSPDSVRWNFENQGTMGPTCDVNGNQLSCGTGASGFGMQRFYYNSDTITLNGVPPTSGWHFYLRMPCCKPEMVNAPYGQSGTTTNLIIRSVMYPDAQNSNAANCNNSSPEFREIANNFICRGYEHNFNYNAIDADNDSIIYRLTYPINSPPPNGAPMAYNPPYSATSPTPQISQNANNNPLSIDSLTGQMRVAVYSNFGIGITGKYAVVVQADEWRNGVKISSVFRELPLSFIDCDSNNQTTPQIKIGSAATSINYLEVFDGDTINLPISVSDPGMINGNGEELILTANGVSISSTYSDSVNCIDSRFRTCAVFKNNAFLLNANRLPKGYKIINTTSINTSLIWIPQLVNSSQAETTNISFKAQDMYCPLPRYNSQILTIKVKPRVTSVERDQTNGSISVYPNPAKNHVIIQTNEIVKSIEVRTIEGRMIQTEWNSGEGILNLPENKGVYFIQIELVNGKRLSKKVVKL